MIPSIWLGSEASFSRHLQLRLFYQENRTGYLSEEAAFLRAEHEDDEPTLSEYLASRMIEKQGGVGIVSIDGALTSDESFYNLWFGDVAYPTIATAVNALLLDSEVQTIVTSWNSPGGDASGINDLGTFLKEAGKIKPIHAWTGTSALSAAYWAAACCKSVRSSDLGETGSIGAIMQFTSVARRLQEDGVDVHIERAGRHKALLQPSEELSEAGKALMQEKVSKLHTFFIDHIEAARPSLKSAARSKWAEGKTYYADEAIALGLVDGPAISLNGLVAKLQKANDRTASNLRGTTMAKQVLLDPQAAAALASGVSIEELKAQGVSTEEVELTDDAPPAEAPADPETKLLETGEGLATYLKDRVTDLEAKLVDHQLRLARAEEQVTQLRGLESALAPIAIEATQRLQVALGQAPSTLLGLPAATLAETYSATKIEFDKRFRSGRVSAEASDEARTSRHTLAEQRLMSRAPADSK